MSEIYWERFSEMTDEERDAVIREAVDGLVEATEKATDGIRSMSKIVKVTGDWYMIDSIDLAWAEAEAAAAAVFGGPTYIALAGPEPWQGSMSYRAECGVDFAVRGEPTPRAALRALIDKLAARTDSDAGTVSVTVQPRPTGARPPF